MEHQTGPDQTRPDGTGPDGTGVADAAQAAAVGVPQSGPGARSEPQGPGADGDAHVPGDGRDDSAVAGTLRADSVPTTGEPRVDAALKLLDRLPGLGVSEHAELFEQVHAQLSDVLGELDSGPAGPAGG